MKLEGRNSILRQFLAIALSSMVLFGCARSVEATAPALPTATVQLEEVAGLSSEEEQTLASLEMVDDYPLYVMHFYAPYDPGASLQAFDGLPTGRVVSACRSSWAC